MRNAEKNRRWEVEKMRRSEVRVEVGMQGKIEGGKVRKEEDTRV
jgi:hypothetical protein